MLFTFRCVQEQADCVGIIWALRLCSALSSPQWPGLHYCSYWTIAMLHLNLTCDTWWYISSRQATLPLNSKRFCPLCQLLYAWLQTAPTCTGHCLMYEASRTTSSAKSRDDAWNHVHESHKEKRWRSTTLAESNSHWEQAWPICQWCSHSKHSTIVATCHCKRTQT